MALLWIAIGLLTAAILKVLHSLLTKSNDLGGYEPQWFASDSNTGTEDATIHKFKINIAEDELLDLKKRLTNTLYEEPLEDVNFEYGFNSKYLRQVVDYWLNQYNWRKAESHLNSYPHFKTNIEGLNVHFIHVKPVLPQGEKIRVVPILLVHGWPGSFYEFYGLIEHLTKPKPGYDFVFEVVCPSIPGYGFSESPHCKGFDARAAARFFVTLMDRLGHRKFYLQGGDWGSLITTLIAKYYPERVYGLHLNMFFTNINTWAFLKACVVAYLPFLISKTEYELFYPFRKRAKYMYEETGYMHMQTTKPETIGSLLCSTPAGLAAYILEKFSTWTNPANRKKSDGGLTEKFTLDQLLTNVMIYWLNNNATAAARFYKENVPNLVRAPHDRIPVRVPSAVSIGRNELLVFPRFLATSQLRDLVFYRVLDKGGHFLAMEEPDLLAGEVWDFVKRVESRGKC